MTTSPIALPDNTTQDRTKGILLAAFATALFSAKGIFIKLAYQYQVDSVTLMSLRMLFSLPVYLALGAWGWHQGWLSSQLLKRHGIPIAGIGLLGYYGASFFDLWGLEYVPAQLERLVLFAYPTFTVLLSWWWMKQRPTRQMFWILPITWAGVAVMVGHDLKQQGQHILLGTGLVATSAVIFAFYMVFSKPLINKVSSAAFTIVAMVAASIGILLHYLFSQPNLLVITQQPLPVYGYGLIIALFCTVLPSFMFSDAIRLVGPDKTSVTGSLGPVCTAIAAVLILGEPFTIWHLLGTAMVVVPITFMAVTKSKH
ncbi:EamA family transporter [Corallincola luteus]|uniref:EamA family transporter n=1 Tax=Corallincola luteus TaxID=1775177 RepID=A0ABY2ARB3_9GAMM|nr:EamA family transporter [Corallincola luteus]TCI04587.1 EamA family transporter [Corallincola luteus]